MNPETRKRVIVLLLVLLLIGVIGGLVIRPTAAAQSDSKRNTVTNAETLGVYPDGSIDMIGSQLSSVLYYTRRTSSPSTSA